MDKELKAKLTTINIDGTNYKTLVNEMYQRRKPWTKPDEKKIISFIPGTIVKIYVKVGQEIKEGTRLFTFDSMKMKNRVASQIDGTVKTILIQEGQTIPKDYLIMEFE
jgi:biotin carboxyl carrier protein